MKKLLVIFLALSFAACKPSTEITGSWLNPNTRASNAAAKIETILVTALTGRANVRETVETDLATALEANGFRTLRSIDVLPPTFTNGKSPDKAELLARIRETKANTILTVALIDKETETRYDPGTYNYAPIPRFGFYGTFWGYYNNWSPMLYSPGYYREDKVYFIETNLYDVDTEVLLWSAQSQTYNPSGLNNFSREFAKIVVANMKDEGLLQAASRPDELASDRENDH
jgi:hypothetical protein